MEEQYEKVVELLKTYDQEHLLTNYNNMNLEDKKRLLNEIEKIDFDLMKKLYQNTKKDINFSSDKIESIECTDKNKLEADKYQKLDDIGTKKVKEGKLAVVTMAGGQGTRLGHSGPKGTYSLQINNREMPLFEILCKTLKEAQEKYGEYVYWYIMTSNQNNKETVEFFEKNNYFVEKQGSHISIMCNEDLLISEVENILNLHNVKYSNLQQQGTRLEDLYFKILGKKVDE